MRIRKAQILFPTAGSRCLVNSVIVRAYPDSHSGRKACPYDEKLADVKRIIGYARDGEDIETLSMDVVVEFDDPDFHGESYGLALAIADKQARHQTPSSANVIFATGIIANKGKVLPVSRFREKIRIATDNLDAGSIFLFPTKNLEEQPVEIRALEEKGIVLRHIETLSEVSELWSEQKAAPVYDCADPQLTEIPTSWSWFFKGSAWGFGFAVIGAIVWVGFKAAFSQ